MRKLLIGFAALIVLLVAALFVVPALIDWSDYKDDLVAELRKATGRDIAIAGALDLAILPRPRIAAHDVSLAGPGDGPPLARIGALSAEVRLIPLLRGAVEVVSVRLDKPVITLVQAQDGGGNWQTVTASPKEERASSDAGALSIESLTLTDGTLIYRAPGKPEQRIEKISAQVSAKSLAGPFDAKGGLTANGVALAFETAVGRIAADGSAPLKISLAAKDLGIAAAVTGQIRDATGAARLEGRLEASAADAARAASRLGVSGLPLAAVKAELEAGLAVDASEFAANDIRLQIGESSLTGGVNVVFGARQRADIALRGRRLDLDSVLAAPAARTAAQPAKAKPGPAAKAAFALPPSLDGSFELALDSVTWRGRQIRELRLGATLAAGTATLDRLEAGLPGGGNLALRGTLSAAADAPAFAGTVDLRADNMRGLLGWLGVEVGAVPADRLRTVSLAGQVRAAPEQAQLLGVRGRLDASAFQGGVTVALRTRPSFGANFVIDHVNIDAYLPQPSAGGPGPAAAAATPDRAPFAPLNGFDANLRLKLGSLTFRRSTASGVVFDGTLLNGKLDIKRAAVEDLAGAAIALDGTVTGFDGAPSVSGNFSGSARDLSTVLGLADIRPGRWARALGAVRVAGRGAVAGDKTTVNAELDAAGGRFRVGAEIAGAGDKPTLALRLGGDHPDAGRLARIFDPGIPAGASPGKVTVSAEITGKPDSAKVDAALFLAGGKTRLTGTVSQPLASPRFALALDVAYPSLAPLVRAFAGNAAGRHKGLAAPASLSAALTGGPSEIAIKDIKLAALGSDIGGAATLDLGGKRPKLAATLSAGEIDTALLAPLAGPAKAKGGGKKTGGAPFSREPLDLSGLDALDATLELSARGITHDKIRLEQVALSAALAGGVLRVKKLNGRLFGGALGVTGTLDGRNRAALELAVSLEKANVKRALFATQGIDLVSGTVDFASTLKGVGRSEYALVSSLDGNGRLAVRNGVIKGIDLPAVSERLGRVGGLGDVLPLVGAALSGGSTPFERLDGTFTVKDGVVRTDDMAMVSKAATADAKGRVDLPRWLIDMTANVRLAKPAGAPPLGVRISGPLDNPRREPTQQSVNAILSLGAGKALQRLLPGRSKKPREEPKTSPAPPGLPTNPQELIGDILKRLGR